MAATRPMAPIPALLLILLAAAPVGAAGLNGVWTKVTSPDPHNIVVFFQERNTVRATGYAQYQGQGVTWYAEGEIDGGRIHCAYHHSLDTMPPGWEQGTMTLTLSGDGQELAGRAVSHSGRWAEDVAFRRLR
jgi:hypothetical protein